MAHVFDGDFSKLESEKRKSILPVDDVIEAIGIKEGMQVIDFGCGIGYFSIPVAKKVGDEGLVIAVDISDRMTSELRKRSQGIQNMNIVKSDSIMGMRADVILLVNVLHELDGKSEFLEECFEALSEEGSVVIIDWQKKEMSMGPPLGHRMSKEEVIALVGRKPLEHPIDESLYFLQFEK